MTAIDVASALLERCVARPTTAVSRHGLQQAVRRMAPVAHAQFHTVIDANAFTLHAGHILDMVEQAKIGPARILQAVKPARVSVRLRNHHASIAAHALQFTGSTLFVLRFV